MKERYADNRTILLDSKLYPGNKDLFKAFLDWEEYKLKRQNRLAELTDRQHKTLLQYCQKLKNINEWFAKPLSQITKTDIKRVYDDLEDGKILTVNKKPFKDLSGYYNKIFKSKLFQMIGKADMAREVLEFDILKPKKKAKFFRRETLKQIDMALNRINDKFLNYLLFDVGENICANLQLKKSDFNKRKNEATNEIEYGVRLGEEKIKRTRTARTEPLHLAETNQYAEIVLSKLNDNDLVFPEPYSVVSCRFNRAWAKVKAVTEPDNKPVTFKDYRSSMAVDGLSVRGMSLDEVKARLGHNPSSNVCDCYVNYLGLDREKPKAKVDAVKNASLMNEIEKLKEANRVKQSQVQKLEAQFSMLADRQEEIEVLSAALKDPDFRNRLKKYKKTKLEA